ncbi:BTAD domain-containing putative transcriptional regulator [Glycomyces tenuis]|nr:BTAD domain-containing putative transcriptional regulator [Glycomyces tenuis]
MTAVIVIGLPALLIAIAGPPWAWQMPSITRLDIALSWPVPENTVKWGLVIIAWALWIWLVARLTWEIIAQVAGHRAASQIRGPIRLLAATLTGTIAATAPAIAAAAEPATVITATATECEATAVETRESDADASQSGQTEAGPKRDSDGNVVHTVRQGDTLWGLADHYYSDPTAYPKIFRANQGIVQSNGAHLTDPNLIINGTELTIPDTAPAIETVPEDPPAIDDSAQDDGVSTPKSPEPEPADTTTPEPTKSDDGEPDDATDARAESAPALDRGTWISAGSFIALSTIAIALAARKRRSRERSRNEGDKSHLAEVDNLDTAVPHDDEDQMTGRLEDLQSLLEEHDGGADDPDTALPLATGTTSAAEVSVLDHARDGLGLIGPGARSVARGALWATLGAGSAVVIDQLTADDLGIDTDLLQAIPGAHLVEARTDLAGEVRRTQASVEYDPETDELHRHVTVLITGHAEAAALPEPGDESYALILGRWDRAWIELAADGTPTGGHLPQLELEALGHCYGLDKVECRRRLADLADTTAFAPDPELPHVVEESEPETDDLDTRAPDSMPEALAPERRFELQLFGSHHLTWNSENVHFRRRACLDLVAVMALTEWALTRDELTEVVAADATLKQASSRRTTTVAEARKALGAIAETDDVLVYDRGRETYRLDRSWFQTDTATFDRNIALAEQADDPKTRTRHLTEALRTYAGPLGADLDDVWDFTDLRSHYREQAYRAALDLAALHDDAGRDTEAVSALERTRAIDPNRTQAWERLAEHHRRRGDEDKAAEIEARAQHHHEIARRARMQPRV